MDYRSVEEHKCTHKGKTFYVVISPSNGRWDVYVTLLGENDAEQQYPVGVFDDIVEAKPRGEESGRAIIDRHY